jgi:hypothetical protein
VAAEVVPRAAAEVARGRRYFPRQQGRVESTCEYAEYEREPLGRWTGQ